MSNLFYYFNTINNFLEVESEIVEYVFQNFEFNEHIALKTTVIDISDISKSIKLHIHETMNISANISIIEQLSLKKLKFKVYFNFDDEHRHKIIYSSDKCDIVGNTYNINIEEKILKHFEPMFISLVGKIEECIKLHKQILNDI